MGAARPLSGAPRFAAYAAGQAACVAHVPEHDLGAAAYAIKAAAAAAPRNHERDAAHAERDWQLLVRLRELNSPRKNRGTQPPALRSATFPLAMRRCKSVCRETCPQAGPLVRYVPVISN
jgi:hypothetical protein